MWEIALEHHSEVGLSQQIYRFLKARILSGQIAQGEAVPSTREWAAALGVSRNTVSLAYDMLWTEGFIVRRQGAPSRIADGLQVQRAQNRQKADGKKTAEPAVRWDLKTGQPDLAAFPWKLWNEMIKAAAESLTAQQFAYNGPKGYAPLCEAIAGWLLRARNMDVNPDDVFITSGSTQALYLLADILRRHNCVFMLEDPCHPGIRTMTRDKGLAVDWMPVDRQGAQPDTLSNKQIAAAYVTPSHQFPLGGILPANRRAALLSLAAEQDFYVIEDDYDSEFRYVGPPVSPIYAMDPSRVIYVGTFSKTLFPALRIGFVVLPKTLQQAWKHSRTYMDVQNPMLEQAALAQFLQSRKMDRHIRRMRKLYQGKRVELLNAVRDTFGDQFIPWGDASGLHIALQFPGHVFDSTFEQRCKNAGIRVSPVSRYCAMACGYTDSLLIGYGHLQMEQIAEGIHALGQIVKQGSGDGNEAGN